MSIRVHAHVRVWQATFMMALRFSAAVVMADFFMPHLLETGYALQATAASRLGAVGVGGYCDRLAVKRCTVAGDKPGGYHRLTALQNEMWAMG